MLRKVLLSVVPMAVLVALGLSLSSTSNKAVAADKVVVAKEVKTEKSDDTLRHGHGGFCGYHGGFGGQFCGSWGGFGRYCGSYGSYGYGRYCGSFYGSWCGSWYGRN